MPCPHSGRLCLGPCSATQHRLQAAYSSLPILPPLPCVIAFHLGSCCLWPAPTASAASWAGSSDDGLRGCGRAWELPLTSLAALFSARWGGGHVRSDPLRKASLQPTLIKCTSKPVADLQVNNDLVECTASKLMPAIM